MISTATTRHATRILPRIRGSHLRFGLGLLLLLAILAAPLLPVQSPLTTSGDIMTLPSARHLLGTDQLGRDVLSRVLAGGRTLTLMSLAAGSLALVLGATVGMLAGFKGGRVDTVLMRLVDLLLALPPLIVILVFLTILPHGVVLPTLLTALFLAPSAARIIRGLTQELTSREFIAAAEAAGDGDLAIIVGEILPNLRGRLILELALRIGFAVLIASSLNFLGVGVQPPSPDWGLAINEGASVLMVAPWVALFPALGVFLLVASINILSDALGELVDVRLLRRKD